MFKLLHDHHLHWPELDVDLEIEVLEHPEQYPLRSKVPVVSVREQVKEYAGKTRKRR